MIGVVGLTRTLTTGVQGVEVEAAAQGPQEEEAIRRVLVEGGRRARVIAHTTQVQGGGAIIRGEVCPLRRACFIPRAGNPIELLPRFDLCHHVRFERPMADILVPTVLWEHRTAASDCSSRTASRWVYAPRGSIRGSADMRSVRGVLVTTVMDPAKEVLGVTDYAFCLASTALVFSSFVCSSLLFFF